jgi:hypothetical protein
LKLQGLANKDLQNIMKDFSKWQKIPSNSIPVTGGPQIHGAQGREPGFGQGGRLIPVVVKGFGTTLGLLLTG